MEAYGGIPLQKPSQDPRQQVGGRDRTRGHVDGAGAVFADLPDLFPCHLAQPQDAARVIVEDAPLGRRRDSGVRPMDDPHARRVFQAADVLRQRRLCDEHPARGPGEAFLLDEGDEAFHLQQRNISEIRFGHARLLA